VRATNSNTTVTLSPPTDMSPETFFQQTNLPLQPVTGPVFSGDNRYGYEPSEWNA